MQALILYGIASAQVDDHEGAIRALTEVVARDPRSFEGWNWLAMQLRLAGRLPEAIEASERMIMLAPNRFDGHNSLGMCQLDERHWDEAIGCFQHAIRLSPEMAVLHNNVGIALKNLGRLQEAERAFKRSIELAPNMPHSYGMLGEVLSYEERAPEAARFFRMAYDREPQTPRGQLNLAKSLVEENRLEDATDVLRSLTKGSSSEPGAIALLAHILFLRGEFEESRTFLRRSIEADPGTVRAYIDLVYSAKLGPADSWLLETVSKQLERTDITDEERAYLRYALGKAHEDLADYKTAISHYDEANRLMLTLVHPIDRALHSSRIDRLISAYPVTGFGARPSDCNSELPIFIVGMIRSGTTLVEQVLSRHPNVEAGGELKYWIDRGNDLDSASASRSWLTRLGEAYIQQLEPLARGKPRITDKMPLNYLYLGPIHAALPGARIIHCKRSPIDTCLSIYLTPFRRGIEFGHDRETIIYTYNEYLRLMDHWRSVLPPDRFLEIQYEDLVSNRETATRSLLDFCGLSWDEACLSPEGNARAVRTPSTWQVRQPVYQTSVGRWRHYEPWLGALASMCERD
jgi:tetratricopeptide (TPR) repeat protein